MKTRYLVSVLLLIFLWLPQPVWAQPTAKSIWETIFNNALSIALFFIFVSALVGTLLKNFAIDKCLRHFDNFHVTLEFTDSDLIWGTLKLYSTGLELLYGVPRLDADGHEESSYILYSSEYTQIQSICRYHGDLSVKERRSREADIRKTYQPTIFSSSIRWLRNLMNTFSDALTKALNLIIGQIKKTSPGSIILSQEAQLTKLGTDIIGYAGNAYDPILERYIGKKVVIWVNYPDHKTEYLGILKEYTSTFLELLNVHYRYVIAIPLKGKATGKLEISGVSVIKEGQQYLLYNQSATSIQVEELVKDGVKSPIHYDIEPGQKAAVFEDEPAIGEAAVKIATLRLVDIVVPRAKALIRHGGPQEKVGWKELLGLTEVEYFFGRFARSPVEPSAEPQVRPRE